ncbi:isochorismatase family protein YddQ [Favolaschia claudopus]|uniref:Isochorismatase family protein YddQ n=1 Tax=Favolaschia claudopus TaxID=2862362 RepID=A0AAW0BJZ7_9AGAR
MTAPKTFLEHVGASPSTVSPSARDSILVIIDAQNEYLDGLLSISKDNIAYSRPNILKLLQRYRAAHAPVAHVVHVAGPGSPMFTPDTSLAEIFPELAPLPDRVGSGKQGDTDFEVLVRKRFPGAFAETTLDALIKQAGVRKVVLVGYMAHVCVSTTAREASQRGYDTFVVADAVGDRDIPVLGGGKLGATGGAGYEHGDVGAGGYLCDSRED